jgi:hypothetical protein
VERVVLNALFNPGGFRHHYLPSSSEKPIHLALRCRQRTTALQFCICIALAGWTKAEQRVNAEAR